MIESRSLQAGPNIPFSGVIRPRFILNVRTDDPFPRFGNGFVLGEWPDTIITAGHVVRDAKHVLARAWTTEEGTSRAFECVATAYDLERDLAVIKLPQSIQTNLDLEIHDYEGGEVALRAFVDIEAWRRRRVKWRPVAATRSEGWIVYASRYGEQGASGGTVIAGDEHAVVGVHRGRIRLDGLTKRGAAVCNHSVLAELRGAWK